MKAQKKTTWRHQSFLRLQHALSISRTLSGATGLNVRMDFMWFCRQKTVACQPLVRCFCHFCFLSFVCCLVLFGLLSGYCFVWLALIGCTHYPNEKLAFLCAQQCVTGALVWADKKNVCVFVFGWLLFLVCLCVGVWGLVLWFRALSSIGTHERLYRRKLRPTVPFEIHMEIVSRPSL